jgi:hypothetical protein
MKGVRGYGKCGGKEEYVGRILVLKLKTGIFWKSWG